MRGGATLRDLLKVSMPHADRDPAYLALNNRLHSIYSHPAVQTRIAPQRRIIRGHASSTVLSIY
jgi:hypothetical protein